MREAGLLEQMGTEEGVLEEQGFGNRVQVGELSSRLSGGNGGREKAETEVLERPVRRRFTGAYKARILGAADACKGHGELGALLRREGLYSSHLTTWRKQRGAGMLAALAPKRRGRKADPDRPLRLENERLRQETDRLKEKLRKAELVIDVQKKVAALLGRPLETIESDETS